MLIWLFESGFMPHGRRHFRRADTRWAQAASCDAIATAHFPVPITRLSIVPCGAGHPVETRTAVFPAGAQRVSL